MISNKTYDILKWIAQILLPALGTLYAALVPLWGLPYGDQIVGTILALDTCLGAHLELVLNSITVQQVRTKNNVLIHYSYI